MKLKNFVHYCKEAAQGVLRNGWMTVASVTVMVLTLLMLGIFVIINLNVMQITEEIKEQVELIVYLEDEADHQYLRQQILELPGIARLTYVSKEEALRRMQEELGEDIADALEGRNPLPASFEIQVHDPETIGEVADAIEPMAGVESVDYGKKVVERLFEFTRILRLFSMGVIAVLAVMALFLIANTIKLTVFARRRQIGIMKFVGATDWFIRWPFILEGIFLGLLGALTAYLVLFYGYWYLYAKASAWFYQNFLSVKLATPALVGRELLKLLFALGAGIGALGSGISVRRFLDV
ncbi:MAG: ABC transporter permease [Firmicutes bacterium]|jgi:cell division transport system permease protein|nr:ABC transporter permease [Bacillota bacterium]HOB35305.1 permease-like cell division protein FtsX [Bacillota bacterium]HPZ90443.1 permease-like cell division protein FtsX [Bacillota bacterium]HQE01445.1 permease-like cell division protein FtsX [Bacillota bacterium]